jgi:lysozyme family protein
MSADGDSNKRCMMTEAKDLNIPIPDPSDITVHVIKDAVAQLSNLVDAKMGGLQAVIAEQFKSIDKRLSDRDATLVTATAAQKETVATALAAVIESGKSGATRFDLLERRVAALELAISGSMGKSMGTSTMSSGMMQFLATLAALVAAGTAYYVATHR